MDATKKCFAVLFSLGLLGGLFRIGSCAESAQKDASEDKITVLSGGCNWRKNYVFFPPRLSVEAATKAGLPTDLDFRIKYLIGDYHVPAVKRMVVAGAGGAVMANYFTDFETPCPPSTWRDVDFNDESWMETSGTDFTGQRCATVRSQQGLYPQSSELPPPKKERLAMIWGTDQFCNEIGLICMRGNFLVKDRAQVKKLSLSLSYRGGFVAYLNGKEVARASVPDGKLDPTTPAEEYPLDVYTGPGGEPILDKWLTTNYELEKLEGRWAARMRRFEPTVIDVSALKAGVNVLAVELHRSDYPAECKAEQFGLCFAPIGLGELRLEAEADAGSVVAATQRPQGVQVWNKEVWQAVALDDFGNPGEELRPIRIDAVRNGTFSGQIILGSTETIERLRVETGSLAASGGKGRILAGNVRIRFGAVNPTRSDPTGSHSMGLGWGRGFALFSWATGRSSPRIDSLLEEAPQRVDLSDREEYVEPVVKPWVPLLKEASGLPKKTVAGAVLPVWVTVQVPKDAAAGDYRGKLRLNAKGISTIEVPIELHVSGWTLPDVKNYASLSCIYQSPDSLAEYYKVALWSEEHWNLIERSLKILGETGNVGLIFPLLAESQFGNAESMVRWIRQADGTWKHDYTIFDRYLETALKYHDPQRIKLIGLVVWHRQLKSVQGKFAKQLAKPFVTMLDPSTGKKGKMQLPDYGTAECEAMWRPVILEIRQRLAAKGLADKMMFGSPDDDLPEPDQVAMFHNILPDNPWFLANHNGLRRLPRDARDRSKTVPIGFQASVYGASPNTPSPKEKRLYGWNYNASQIELRYNRYQTANSLDGFPEPWLYRLWMEAALLGGLPGAGHIGGDYFHHREGYRCLFSIYPESSVAGLGIESNYTTSDLLAPGPEGAVATVRFENAREGIEESEARVFLERALLDKDKPLPENLAKRCQDLLDERREAIRVCRVNMLYAYIFWRGHTLYGLTDARSRIRRLYDLAGEVAAITR